MLPPIVNGDTYVSSYLPSHVHHYELLLLYRKCPDSYRTIEQTFFLLFSVCKHSQLHLFTEARSERVLLHLLHAWKLHVVVSATLASVPVSSFPSCPLCLLFPFLSAPHPPSSPLSHFQISALPIAPFLLYNDALQQ